MPVDHVAGFRAAHLVTPPRVHKHRYCGVLAPNAKLRAAVTASAGPAGAVLQVLEQAREKMGLPKAEGTGARPLTDNDGEPRSAAGGAAGTGAAAGRTGVRGGGSADRPDGLAGDRPDRRPGQLELNPPDSTDRPTLECLRDRDRDRRRRTGLPDRQAKSRRAARNRASRGRSRPFPRPQT